MTRFALSASPALSFLLSLVACGGNDSDERPCTDSSECIKGGEPGQCLPSPESNQSWCAFDDGACNSSLRWGSLTGDGLADECVDEGDIIPDAGMPDAGVDAGISDAGPGDDGGETDAIPPGGAFVRGFGSTGDDIAFALDTFGTDVIVAGVFEETVDFGGGDLVSAGNQDGFVAKYGADGAFVWSRRFGGTSIDKAFGVAVDSVGDVFVAGEFLGTASFGGSDLTSAGIRDAFIAKYDAATGAHVWSCRIGGADTDIAKAITSDGTDVIVVGSFRGTVDFGGGAVSSNGSTDAFVAKYSGVDCSHVESRVWRYVNRRGQRRRR